MITGVSPIYNQAIARATFRMRWKGADGQSEPFHGSVQPPLCVLVQDADFAQLFTVELMIRAPEAPQLPVPRSDDRPADSGRAFHTSAAISQELLRLRRHFDVHVDAVEQRA
jgi:hypothetical protein